VDCGNCMEWDWGDLHLGGRKWHEVHGLNEKMGELEGDRLNYFLRSFAMMAWP
jgi:hypothetical protein